MNASQRRIYYRAIQRQWPDGTEVTFMIGSYCQAATIIHPRKVGRSVWVRGGGVSVIKAISTLRKAAPKQEGTEP